MKLRALPVALTAVLFLSGIALASPASAVPAAPVIGPLSTSTPDHVTGTVSSDQPYVILWLSEYSDSPKYVVTLAESNAFDLPSWGYGSYGLSVNVVAAACPTGTYDEGTCSPLAYSSFYPSQLVPSVTWPTDTAVGAGDPDPVVTISDPDGSGEFNVIQFGYNSSGSKTPVTAGVPTPLEVVDGLNGGIYLERCSPDRAQCRGYTANTVGVSSELSVLRDPDLDVGPVKTVFADRDSSFTLAGGAPGSAEVTWHLERTSAPGTVVGGEHTSSVEVDSYGSFAPITVPRSGLYPATNGYVVVGTVDLASTDFGTFADEPFTSAPFTVSGSNAVTWTANHAVIYPNVNTTAYPGKVTWGIRGIGGETLSKVQVWSATDTVITSLGVSSSNSTSGAVQWNGRLPNGKSAPSGYYKLMLWDSEGDPVKVKPIVRVDARRMITKTWVKTVSAAGSVVDQYVGRCSTLRKPAGRGWSYSLGFWANTRCSTTGSTASLVSTVHAVRLPKIAGNYATVRVSLYGGAATSKPGSQAVIRYLTAAGTWTSDRVVTAPLTHHSGLQRAASGMVYSDRSFAWGLYTLNGHRYDVKTFSVVVRYHVLG